LYNIISREGLLKLREIYSKNQKFGDSQSAELALQANDSKLASLYESLKKYQDFYTQVEQNTSFQQQQHQHQQNHHYNNSQQQHQQQSAYFECSSNCSGSSDSNSSSHIGGVAVVVGGTVENCMKREDKLPDMSNVRALQQHNDSLVVGVATAVKVNEYTHSPKQLSQSYQHDTSLTSSNKQSGTPVAAAAAAAAAASSTGNQHNQVNSNGNGNSNSSKMAPLVSRTNNESFEDEYDIDEIDNDGCYEVVNRTAFNNKAKNG
jgi:hypothetical protein